MAVWRRASDWVGLHLEGHSRWEHKSTAAPASVSDENITSYTAQEAAVSVPLHASPLLGSQGPSSSGECDPEEVPPYHDCFCSLVCVDLLADQLCMADNTPRCHGTHMDEDVH